MNANELADELERPNNWQQENNFTTRAATMLRQQQAEIEALKIENSHLKYEISSGAWNPVKELTDEEILIVWTSSNFVRYTENGQHRQRRILN